MKKITLIFFCLSSLTAFAQKMPDAGFYKVRITLTDKTIVAEINPVSANPAAKKVLNYYWYEANEIHVTQGGFSGKLLDGQYTEYYADKNLKEQGNFKKGLKNGEWKSWNEDGTLAGSSSWKNGLLMPAEKISIWKRLDMLHKRKTRQAADTLQKAAK